MIVISWNVNGLRAAIKHGFLEWFSEAKLDVLCLRETKISDGNVLAELSDITPYSRYFSFAGRKGYSGVALYSQSEPLSVETTFGSPEFDDEGRHLIADYGDFLLANVYFPNGKASYERLEYKLAYYDAFLEFAVNVVASGKNLVVCGDVNTAHKEIDLARPKANQKTSGFLPVERQWMDRLVSHGFVDTFRVFDNSPEMYTWWSQRTRARERNIGWRLDYFFVNRDFASRVKRSWILSDVTGSDHCPVGLEIDF